MIYKWNNSCIIHLWEQKRKRSTTKYACKRITIHILSHAANAGGRKAEGELRISKQTNEWASGWTSVQRASSGNSFTLMFLLDNSFVEFTTYHYRHRCQYKRAKQLLAIFIKINTAQNKTKKYMHTHTHCVYVCVCVEMKENFLEFLRSSNLFEILWEREQKMGGHPSISVVW